MQHECQLNNQVCTFILNFNPGNYKVMPVILDTSKDGWAYLFERSDG